MKKSGIYYAAWLTIFSLFLSSCNSLLSSAGEKTVSAEPIVVTVAMQPSAMADPIGTPPPNSPAGSLSALQLLSGITQLEGSGQAVSSDQAKNILPLWQKFLAANQNTGITQGSPAGGAGGNPPTQANNSIPQKPSGSDQTSSLPPASPGMDQNAGGPPADAGNSNNAQSQAQMNDLINQIQAFLTRDQIKAISAMNISQDNIQTVANQLGLDGTLTSPGNGIGQPNSAPPAAGQPSKTNQPMLKPPSRAGDNLSPELINAFIQLLAKKAGVTLPTAAGPSVNPPGQNDNSAPTNTLAAYKQNGGNITKSNQAYTAASADESGINVTSGGNLTLTGATITTSGDTSSSDKSSFYGLNAAVLADSASKITLADSAVTTSGKGANGVFSTGAGSDVILSNDTIKATGDGAHGVMATQGGTMTLSNVNIDTAGASSAAYATDRGGGTLTAKGGKVTTSGFNSPGVYSTGSISITDASISATGAESAVIEGANSITLKDTTLTSSKDNKWGVMIYQSFSGDAQGSRGVFTMTGGSMANIALNGPLFYVTNTSAVIMLKGVKVTAASGILLNASAGNWGNKGSNGGAVQLTGDGQALSGNLTADAISSIGAQLSNGSSLNGAINPDQKAGSVTLILDSTSHWNVTADSYLNVLSDKAGISGASITNISGNGFTVYYDASLASNNLLGGKTYSLVNGGQLTPKK